MPADAQLQPLWKVALPELVSLSNEAFADYFVPVRFTEPSLLSFLALMGISWDLSRVMLKKDRPVGFILIARRGWSMRVASMGVLPDHRNHGHGSRMLANVIDKGRTRGDRFLELEVITTNSTAVKLYKATGFEVIQDLYGFRRKAAEAGKVFPLEKVDIRAVAHRVAASGARDLPWQLSAETLACYGPPSIAMQLDGAYAVISDPGQSSITLLSLIVEPDRRGEGRGRALLNSLLTTYSEKDFTIPAICPAEFELLFKSVGFERVDLSQHHMRLNL
ncbi:MAG: GNAT family N-acetyltransferase [Anaerolineales bacterium]